MNRAYLFVYGDDLGTREEVKTILEAIPQIVNWRYEMPNSFYLISSETAETLSALIRMESGKDKPTFLVVEILSNRYGWLNPEGWEFIRKKKAVGD